MNKKKFAVLAVFTAVAGAFAAWRIKRRWKKEKLGLRWRKKCDVCANAAVYAIHFEVDELMINALVCKNDECERKVHTNVRERYPHVTLKKSNFREEIPASNARGIFYSVQIDQARRFRQS